MTASFAALKHTTMLAKRSVAINLTDQGFVSAVNFLTVVLLARYLSLETFGIFMIGHTVLALLTAVQNSLVAQPHNILGPQRTGLDYTRLTFVLGGVQLAFGIVLLVVIALIGVILQRRGSTTNAQLVFALALTVPPWMGQEFVRRVLYTQKEAVGATINNVVSYGLQLFGILAVTLQVGGLAATAANAMLVLGLSSLVAMVLGIWQLRGQLAPRVVAQLPERRSFGVFFESALDTWRLSKWLVAQQLVTWLGTSGQGLLLAVFLGPASFGVYRAAYQVVTVLNPIRQAAMNHLPSSAARAFAHDGVSGLKAWVRKMSWALTVPFVVCAVVVAATMDLLASLMYGATTSLPLLHVVVVGGLMGYILTFARTPLDYAVLVGGGARSLFLRALLLMAFVWTAGVALIWKLGIVGVMISEVIGALIAVLLTVRIYVALIHRGQTPSSAHIASNRTDSATRVAPPLFTLPSSEVIKS